MGETPSVEQIAELSQRLALQADRHEEPHWKGDTRVLLREASDALSALQSLAQDQARLKLALVEEGGFLRRAEQERDALRKERAWQPIETHPKDGADVLLTDGHWVRKGYWARRRACWSVDTAVALKAPTHWAPLPHLSVEAPATGGTVKAQETEDAELVALAAVVAHDAMLGFAHTTQYGQLIAAPDEEAAVRLRAMLVERGVLQRASTPEPREEG